MTSRGGGFPGTLLPAAAIFLLLAGCGGRNDGTPVPRNVSRISTVVSRPGLAADFTWNAPDGTGRSLATAGGVTLVNFWATWCAPCKKEIPDLIEMHRRYSDRGFSVIGIATDRTPNAEELVADFVEQHGIPYQILLSTDETEAAYNNVNMMPTSFFVDREGRIVRTVVGLMTKSQLEQIITPLL